MEIYSNVQETGLLTFTKFEGRTIQLRKFCAVKDCAQIIPNELGVLRLFAIE